MSSNRREYEYVHRYVVAAIQRATNGYSSRMLAFVFLLVGRGGLATTRSPVASYQFSTKQVWKVMQNNSIHTYIYIYRGLG